MQLLESFLSNDGPIGGVNSIHVEANKKEDNQNYSGSYSQSSKA
jgi:hypothetical protein